MQVDQPPRTYGFERVTFGDKPAGAICAAAIKMTAETYSYVDEDAAMKMQRDAYVDGIATGAETNERIEEMKTGITTILGKGGFAPKGFVADASLCLFIYLM